MQVILIFLFYIGVNVMNDGVSYCRTLVSQYVTLGSAASVPAAGSKSWHINCFTFCCKQKTTKPGGKI